MINTKAQHIQKGCPSQDFIHTSISYAKFAFFIGIAVCVNLLLADMAFAAAKFDLNAGIVAATNPLITGAEAHWGKGVLLTGVGSALMGEGDGWQRGRRALIGCGGAGAVILGLIATLK